jgi:thioesterase domain-containing protein/acyl carrier protein
VAAEIARLWREILAVESDPGSLDFFSAGGDSLSAAQLLVRVGDELGVEISLFDFMHEPTVSGMTAIVERARPAAATGAGSESALVPIQPRGQGLPLFCAATGDGSLFGFARLAGRLDPCVPLWGFPPPTVQDTQAAYSVESLATRYVELLRARQPRGPYALMGECAGGVVAYEMARQLACQDERIRLLVMVDAFNRAWWRHAPRSSQLGHELRLIARRGVFHLGRLARLPATERRAYLGERLRAFTRRASEDARQHAYEHALAARTPPADLLAASRVACERYEPTPLSGDVVLIRGAEPRAGQYAVPAMGWAGLIRGQARVYEVPDLLRGLLSEPAVSRVAELLRPLLGDA